PEDLIHAALRRGVIDLKIFPVMCGSALKNKGVPRLLDAVAAYMPSPLDIPDIQGTNPETGEPETRPADADAPVSALAFKIMSDPFVGRLTFVRVYSGQLTAGTYVYNASKGKKERIGRLLKMHAN